MTASFTPQRSASCLGDTPADRRCLRTLIPNARKSIIRSSPRRRISSTSSPCEGRSAWASTTALDTCGACASCSIRETVSRERSHSRARRAIDQPRAWRYERSKASEEIEELRARVERVLEHASTLLATDPGSAAEWFALAGRLRDHCAQLANGIYRLHEWAEPDDARSDISDIHARRLAKGDRVRGLTGGDVADAFS
jgi:hypothetical protein